MNLYNLSGTLWCFQGVSKY